MCARWTAAIVAASVVAGGVGPGWAARREPLREPRPVPLRCGVSPGELRRQVLEALAAENLRYAEDVSPAARGVLRVLGNANWVAVPATDDEVEATLTVRDHVLVARILFGPEEVRVRYHDSVNLNYAVHGRRRYVHPKVNAWLAQLATAVRTVVAAACVREKDTEQSPSFPACTAEQVAGMRRLGLREEQIRAACRGGR